MQFIISFEARPECSEAFGSLMRDTLASLPDVAGCHSVAVYRAADNTDRYTLIETWESREDHQAHVSTMVQSGTWDDILRMLARPPESGYFASIA